MACTTWYPIGTQCPIVSVHMHQTLFWAFTNGNNNDDRFLGCFILPFSPRWLCSKGRYDEALQTLAKLHANGDVNDPYVRMEYDEIMEQIKFEETKAVKSYAELFRSPSTRRRVILAAGMQLMQQWTGINAVFVSIIHSVDALWKYSSSSRRCMAKTDILVQYYAPFIFQSAGLTGTLPSLLATGVNGIVNVIFTIPALLYFDRWGRRKTVIAGGIGMASSMLIAGALLKGM